MAESAPISGIAAPVVASGSSPVALKSAPKVEVSVSELMKAGNGQAPRKGSVREEMFNKLREKAGPEPGTERPKPEKIAEKVDPEKVKPVSADEPEEVEELGEEEAEPAVADPKEVPEAKAGEKTADKSTDKKPKLKSWELVKQYKQEAAETKVKLAEAEKRAIPEAKWKEVHAELEAKSKRLAEVEEEIRFVNYSKSGEFQEKYQKPYQAAWNRALNELGELTVENANGEVRALNANDILELVNMPLSKAFTEAQEKFGALAPEVMAHRKEIKKLADEQHDALEGARKNGADREKTITETRQREHGEITKHVTDTWAKENENITIDPKYGKFFTPRDGDAEGNQRLAKGYEMADRAFAESPFSPGLTAEQRSAIVKRHSAVRNRSAAFGRLVHEISQKDKMIAEKDKIIAEYKGSEPSTGSDKKPAPQAVKRTGMSDMIAELHKRAKPIPSR